VVRQGENKPLSVTITRDIIKVQSVKNRVLEPGFGYIRITQFQARTTEDLQKSIAELKKKTKEVGLNGLVLDLRNNPGGLLTAAVGVSDAFLTEGGIVSIKGRNEEDKIVYNSESIIPGDMLDGIPVVVLINGGSASASEIVAGALQDHSRAVIIGTTSFGKGSVQTINELRQGNAVKLTTARYYTPNGRTIQAKGIEPDIKLSRVKVELLDDFGFKPVKESQLEGHLENDKVKQTEDKDKPLTPDELVKRDYQLYEALNLLKGLQVIQSIKK
jgi:carboxyl-terminal processing protease